MQISCLPEFHQKAAKGEKKMGRKKIKVVQEVFSDISKALPYMQKFIEKNLEEICSREHITVKKVFFFGFSAVGCL